MPRQPIELPAGERDALRAGYLDGRPMAALAREAGVSVATLRRMIREMELPPRRQARPRPAGAGWQGRARLPVTARIRAAIEQELERIEGALAAEVEPAAGERAARTLASLVRTLNELRRLDEKEGREAEHGGTGDFDDIRRILARRLAGLRGSGAC